MNLISFFVFRFPSINNILVSCSIYEEVVFLKVNLILYVCITSSFVTLISIGLPYCKISRLSWGRFGSRYSLTCLLGKMISLLLGFVSLVDYLFRIVHRSGTCSTSFASFIGMFKSNHWIPPPLSMINFNEISWM